MRKYVLVILLVVTAVISMAQTPADLTLPIVEEGKRLYRSEMASWYGTDLFLENYKDKAKIQGYFSYTQNGYSTCVFYSKGDHPVIIGEVIFDSTYNTNSAKISLTERPLSPLEAEIHVLREVTLKEISTDTSLFKTYNNTSLNLIPLISETERKVYVLTGPKNNRVVIFGNDYLLTFDNNNALISKKQLHKNLIPIYYGEKEQNGKEVEGTIHTHLPETGEFITATDICTLMLYEKFAKWKRHNVVSKNYLSIWDCQKDQLAVVPMSTIEKINGKGEKKNKRNNREN